MGKSIAILLMSCIACCRADSQSADNYRETVTFVDRMTVDEYWDDVMDNIGFNARRTRTYYDGMGKPVQETDDATALSGRRTVSHLEYDRLGRVSNAWLRLPSSNGLSYTPAQDIANIAGAFYNDGCAYSSNTYDALGRLASTTQAGADWHGKSKRRTVRYDTNAEGEVKWYKAPMDKVSLVADGCYPAGSLNCEETTDEDGRTVAVYKDFLGNKVLERRDSSNDTYFVYNDIGQLRYVLSPEYQKSGYKDQYAYEYRYDAKGRVVKKILPGCEYTQYWYDVADRMSFMQDATLRERGLYRFFLYDAFGRMAVQGTCGSCNRGESVATAVYMEASEGFLGTGYELEQPDRIDGAVIESVAYYDDYDFLRLCGNAAGALCDSLRREGYDSAKGYRTGCLQYSSSGNPVLDVSYHDLRGNIVSVRRAWSGNRLTVTDTEYTHTNDVRRTAVREYSLTSNGLELASGSILENVYGESDGALLATRFSVLGGSGMVRTQTVKTYAYDEVGRLKSVTRDGSAGSVSYAYNLKGWTTNIDSDGFHEELHYTDGAGTPCYNGDISSMLWQTPEYPQVRGYKFCYDGLDRLQEAVYGETPSLSDKPNRYNEKVVEYTANGAIRRFQRRGRKDDGEYGKIDNLNIRLDGNRLHSVTDDALPANKYSSFNFVDGADENVEYTYNGVGALTRDLNRGVTMAYDNLNNPRTVKNANGSSLTYDYLPDGTLMSKSYDLYFDITGKSRSVSEDIAQGISPTDTVSRIPTGSLPEISGYGTSVRFSYSGNAVYWNGKLFRLLFPGGYCTFNGDKTPVFHYFTQDHLGNNRVVTKEDGTVEQITHYYPFGGPFGDAGLNPELQPYKYNGKELDRMFGLDTYDYGARQYFPALPVWDRMDPLCEIDYNVSPYVYCRNNPIRFFDDKGEKVLTAIIVDNDLRKVQFYNSPSKFRNAMLQFVKTNYGRQILSDFTPIGKSIFGVKGNGKYSDFDLIIQEFSFTDGNSEMAAFGDKKAISGLRYSENDRKPYFVVSFNLSSNSGELLETMIHEFAIHLSKYGEVLNCYKSTKRFSAAMKIWNSVPESTEHHDIVKKNNKVPLRGTVTYKKTRMEALKNNPSLKHSFDDADKNNEKLY